MENPKVMILHSLIIGLVLYFIMFYILKQEQIKAETRSILIGAIVLIYMTVFGHDLPNSINKNIF
jgi:hypothetical protein